MLHVSPEVETALAEGRPVVALESSLVAHGMPWPRNVETALALESDARARGAVPATVAVLAGRLRVGLNPEELESLGRPSRHVAKLSARDLGIAISRGLDGATTVAGTLVAARLAGIAVFATGGIGGVHRGAEQSFDVSADFEELARSPVLVVTAGAKAILDLPKTLELLETRGIPVAGYRTDEFPAFYSRSSGLRLEHRLDSVAEVARAFRCHRDAGLIQAFVVANPVPQEAEIPAAELEATVAAALGESPRGKAVTPYLLARVVAATAGRSLDANVALVRNNVALAAEVAGELSAFTRCPQP